MILQHHEAYISHFIFIFFLIRWFLTTFTPSGNDFNILFGTWGLLSLRFFFLDLSKLDILYDEFFGDEIKVFIFTFLNPFHDILFKCWMSCHFFFFLTSTSWWLFILISWVISDLMSSSSANLVKGIKSNSQLVRNKKNRENTH